jgi:ubiquinone/menaquinone biosynthesis C-methylase UbiE
VRVDFVDLSAGMVGIAQRRADAIGSQASARTEFHVGDVREFNENADGERYDLITAHFFLDCFSDEDVARVAGKLASFARTGARLLLSDFRIPPHGIGRYVDAAIVRGLYGAFRMTTGLRVTRLPDYEGALGHAGFRKQRETLKLGGLLTASLWHKI